MNYSAYILMVVFHVHGGSQLSMQEFDGRQSCLAAKSYLQKTVDRSIKHSGFDDNGIVGFQSVGCIPKGSRK